MRKWLTYVALLFAGAFFVGDATSLMLAYPVYTHTHYM